MTTRPLLTKGEKRAMVAVAAGCVLISFAQAVSGTLHWASNPLESVWVCGMIFCALAGSQALMRLAERNYAFKRGLRATVFAVAACVIELVSVNWSLNAVDMRLEDTIRTETLNSPEYRQIQSGIKSMESDIQSLQNKIRGACDDCRTNVTTYTDQIASLRREIRRETRRAQNLDVSSTGRTMANIESSYGVTKTDIAFLIAIALSIIPAFINIGTSEVASNPRVVAGKKSKGRPKLRSVA